MTGHCEQCYETICICANKMGDDMNSTQEKIFDSVNLLQWLCHTAAKDSGWWQDIHTGEAVINRPHCVGEKLMLIVSEVSEAMEGHRKDLMDDKLPHRKMVEVELADAVIRIFDLAGAMGLDMGGAIMEKMQYNATREDHKIENRRATGGKAY